MLDSDNNTKLCDFGVSRPVSFSSGIEFSTLNIGTFIYMSPEMSNRIEEHQNYQFNTDCWSLGCILYELINLELFYKSEIKNDDAIIERLANLEIDCFNLVLERLN